MYEMELKKKGKKNEKVNDKEVKERMIKCKWGVKVNEKGKQEVKKEMKVSKNKVKQKK